MIPFVSNLNGQKRNGATIERRFAPTYTLRFGRVFERRERPMPLKHLWTDLSR